MILAPDIDPGLWKQLTRDIRRLPDRMNAARDIVGQLLVAAPLQKEAKCFHGIPDVQPVTNLIWIIDRHLFGPRDRIEKERREIGGEPVYPPGSIDPNEPDSAVAQPSVPAIPFQRVLTRYLGLPVYRAWSLHGMVLHRFGQAFAEHGRAACLS